MATVTDTITSATESTLDAIVGIQQSIVDVNREFASVLAGLLPDVPSWLQPSDSDDAVDPKEFVQQGYAFQARLLEANKEFSIGLIEAWAQAAAPAKADK